MAGAKPSLNAIFLSFSNILTSYHVYVLNSAEEMPSFQEQSSYYFLYFFIYSIYVFQINYQ
jgi:hypothetical protein